MGKTVWEITRKAPYTEIGIRRLKCVRCGNPAKFQWQICSDGNNYRPICLECDLALNDLVLRWMNHPQAESLSKSYADRKTAKRI